MVSPGTKRSNPFIPVGNTNPDKRVSRLVVPPGTKGPTLLSRLVTPTRTKGWPFCPGWCYQPGQKAPPRDSSKGSYSILSHVYYLGELARKPCARQEVLGSNPVVCKRIFNVRHILSRFCHPSRKPCPGSKTGTKASLEPGQKAKSVVVIGPCCAFGLVNFLCGWMGPYFFHAEIWRDSQL